MRYTFGTSDTASNRLEEIARFFNLSSTWRAGQIQNLLNFSSLPEVPVVRLGRNKQLLLIRNILAKMFVRRLRITLEPLNSASLEP
jgi:hypothetical protein